MNIKEIIKKRNIHYSQQKYNRNIDIIKFKGNSKLNVIHINKKNDKFTIERDLFDFLKFQNIPYIFILENTHDDHYFYLEFNNNNNWLSSSFENCTKEELYFGKIILDNKITDKDLTIKIKNLCN